MGSGLRRTVACGVDIGSTNLKVVLLDDDGIIVGRARVATPRDAAGLSIDTAALMRSLEEMILAACGDAYAVAAVSVAGIGEDGVLVDGGMRVLTDALSWFDPRRKRIFRSFKRALHDDELFDAYTDPARTMTGWKWSREQQLDAAATHWLAVTDFPGSQWSGQAFMSDTLASRTGAWRTSDRSWNRERVELTLGTMSLLPPVRAAGEIVGNLRAPSLLAAGAIVDAALVVAGGHDHPIGGWGVHQLSPGAVLDSMGTAEVVVLQAPEQQHHRQEGVDFAPGIRSDGRTLMRVEELSRNVAWASQDPDVGRFIRALIDGDREPAPVLQARHFRPGGRGGGRPSYALDAPSDAFARASAVLGALAVAGAEAVEAVRAEARTEPVVRSAGGWARSPGWLRIKEAVSGYAAVPVGEPEVTAASAALLAATALGWSPDPVVVFSEVEV